MVNFFKKIYLFIYLFIYFWLCWVFVAAHGFSLVVASRGYSLLQYKGFSLWWLLLLQSMALGMWASVVVTCRLSSCGSRALECRLNSCGTRGLVAPRHVGSSRTRARTHVPCIGRPILNHCATREALNGNFHCRILYNFSNTLKKKQHYYFHFIHKEPGN